MVLPASQSKILPFSYRDNPAGQASRDSFLFTITVILSPLPIKTHPRVLTFLHLEVFQWFVTILLERWQHVHLLTSTPFYENF